MDKESKKRKKNNFKDKRDKKRQKLNKKYEYWASTATDGAKNNQD